MRGVFEHSVFDFYKDFPIRPRVPERLFFALFPDAETASLTERFGQRFQCDNHLVGNALQPERLHVSLHHVGDYKRLRSKFIFAARQAANAVSVPPFEVSFRAITSFSGGRRRYPLVLLGEGEALRRFHQLLGDAMQQHGLCAQARFTPHMTLSYGSQAVTERPIEPIRFVADSFFLVHSRLGLGQYDMLDRWTLRH